MSYAARADAVLNAFSSRLQQVPMAMPQMCVAAWMKTKTPLRQVCNQPACVLPQQHLVPQVCEVFIKAVWTASITKYMQAPASPGCWLLAASVLLVGG
jgi:hypothetical protein